MTGFGQGEASCCRHDIAFTVEISTVNRKQLDMRINMPTEFSSMEAQLRKIISNKLHRGTVMAKIEFMANDAMNSGNVAINKPLLSSLITECHDLAAELHINQTINISELLMLPGMVSEQHSMNSCQDCTAALIMATEKALKSLLKMRTKEGNELKLHLATNLNRLESIVGELAPATAKLPQVNREKLLKRLNEAGLDIEANDERIMREIVIFADRYDVSEELARLQSHFIQFKHFINNVSDPVGRSLEFVIQEIQREITTLGNKAAACDISPLVVNFKGELEKIREQVMNIE